MKQQPIHVEPVDDIKPHSTSPDCQCRPIARENGQLWVHRSFDGREMDEEGHTVELPALVAEELTLFAYWMHWISKSKALECLQITQQAFDARLHQWLERLPQEHKEAEEKLRPSQD